mmetsp:Transcript_31777/g.80344  ORF Transcript_31777/g.80344 Transcript_31777/m.80344 type:complete len:224 (+) Transcript_31777:392-1063(+)
MQFCGIHRQCSEEEVVSLCHCTGQRMGNDEALRKLFEPLPVVRSLRPSRSLGRSLRRHLSALCAINKRLCQSQVWPVDHLALPTESPDLALRCSKQLLGIFELLGRWRESRISHINLRWVDRHLPVEATIGGLLRLLATTSQVLQVRIHSIDGLYTSPFRSKQSEATAQIEDLEPIAIGILPALGTNLSGKVLCTPSDCFHSGGRSDLMGPEWRLRHLCDDGH